MTNSRKTRQLNLRLTDAEVDEIKAIAEADGQTASSWARALIRAELRAARVGQAAAAAVQPFPRPVMVPHRRGCQLPSDHGGECRRASNPNGRI